MCSGAGEFSSGLIIHSFEYQMVQLRVFLKMETGGMVGAHTDRVIGRGPWKCREE